jgi:hypothetical protein
VQINVGDVDPATGKYTNTFKTFAISGYVRQNVSAGVRGGVVGAARSGRECGAWSRVDSSFFFSSQSESDTAISALAAGKQE